MTYGNTKSTPVGVILVEDEPLIRMIAESVLCDCGFQVFVATDAYEALRILESEAIHIQVLFTDVNMPGELNGLELAYLVHDRWPRVRLLVTSGGARAGPQDVPDDGRFISKPYSLRRMCSLVDELVGAGA